MPKERFSIGEMKKMTGVSVSALRFYDQMGLIKPSYVDEETGFRYYGYEHFWQIEIIKMCREMKLPLKDLKGVLESQDDRRFMDFLEEQRRNTKTELRRLKEVVADISWMEWQWENKARMLKEPLIFRKYITERAVIPAWWEKNFTNDSLHLKLQQQTENELKHLKTIRRHYGYILDMDKFMSGEVDTLAEFLELEEYRHTEIDRIEILPAGEYACYVTKIFSRETDMKPFLDYLKENGLIPKRIVAPEVAMTFFDWRECLFEVQALL